MRPMCPGQMAARLALMQQGRHRTDCANRYRPTMAPGARFEQLAAAQVDGGRWRRRDGPVRGGAVRGGAQRGVGQGWQLRCLQMHLVTRLGTLPETSCADIWRSAPPGRRSLSRCRVRHSGLRRLGRK